MDFYVEEPAVEEPAIEVEEHVIEVEEHVSEVEEPVVEVEEHVAPITICANNMVEPLDKWLRFKVWFNRQCWF